MKDYYHGYAEVVYPRINIDNRLGVQLGVRLDVINMVSSLAGLAWPDVINRVWSSSGG